MTPAEVISSMRCAGVRKIVISVDQYHNTLKGQAVGAVSMNAVEVAVRTCCEEGFGTRERHLMIASVVDDCEVPDPMLDELVRRLNLVAVDGSCWRFGSYTIHYYAQPIQEQGRAATLRTWTGLTPLECSNFHCPNSLPYTEEGGGERVDMPSVGPPPGWLIQRLHAGDIRYQGWAHTIAVGYAGDVSTCGSHMFTIGQLERTGLDEILTRANIGPWGSDVYARNLALWCLLQHAPHDNGEIPLGNIGSAAQLIHDHLPQYRGSLTCKHAICSAMVTNPEIGLVLFDHWACHLPSHLLEAVQRTLRGVG